MRARARSPRRARARRYTLYPVFERAVLRLQRDGAAPPGGAGAPRARACGADTRLLAGFATLSVTTAFTHPLDTLRVRLAVDADLARAGAARALRAIVAREGWRLSLIHISEPRDGLLSRMPSSA